MSLRMSVDYFPDGDLKLVARAQPVSAHPVRLEFQDADGSHQADFTIFTRRAHIAVRLEKAINAAMTNTDGDGRELKDVIQSFVQQGQKAQDAIEELIGPHVDPVREERDKLFWTVQELIGLVQLVRATLPQEQQDQISNNHRFTSAVNYLAELAPPTTDTPIIQAMDAGVPTEIDDHMRDAQSS